MVKGVSTTPTARVRLAAFAGHGHIAIGTTVHLGDTARFIRTHLQTHHDLYRVTRFADPVLALLELLAKLRDRMSRWIRIRTIDAYVAGFASK